jgi:hypothetical protein
LQHLRTWAYTILGCDAALRHEVRGAPRDMLARGATRDTMVRDATGDTMVRDATGDMMVRDATRDMMVRLATRLADAFPVSSTRENDAWPWPEDTVTYDNAVLPQALLAAGHRLGRVEWVALGTRVLEWLARTQTSPSGYLTPIGNRGWWNRGSEPARFDQQPIEAASLLDASYTAWRVTGAACWLQLMGRAWQWFLGRNGMRTPLADAARGACHDGLGLEGANRNQGAESTLAWLLAVERMREIEREVATADAPWQAGDTWQGSNSPAATTRLPSVVKA